MKKLQRVELIKDLAQQAIDRGATSIEEIHQYIAGLPFDLLEKTGALREDRLKLRDRQRRTIGMVYDAIRSINRQIGQLISDQFELAEDSAHIADTLQQAAAAPRKTAARKTAAPKKKAAAKRPAKAKKKV